MCHDFQKASSLEDFLVCLQKARGHRISGEYGRELVSKPRRFRFGEKLGGGGIHRTTTPILSSSREELAVSQL